MRKKLILILIIALITVGTIPAYGANKKTTKTIEGTIERLNFNDSTIRVLDYNGKSHNIKIHPSTIISLEGVWIDFAQLYFGQEVDIILENNKAKKNNSLSRRRSRKIWLYSSRF